MQGWCLISQSGLWSPEGSDDTPRSQAGKSARRKYSRDVFVIVNSAVSATNAPETSHALQGTQAQRAAASIGRLCIHRRGGQPSRRVCGGHIRAKVDLVMLVHRVVLRMTVAAKLDVTRGLRGAEQRRLFEMRFEVSSSQFGLQLTDALH